MNQPQTFTAAEISRASGSISRQGVAKLLLDVPACGVRVARGNQETPCWSVAVLPESLRERLEADARRQGYRNAETLLANPPSAWRSPVPLRDIAEDEINNAAKLRAVLAPLLNDSKPAVERDALIVARYGDAFGSVITADYARKLFQRTIDRDAGVRDYGRIDLYLPENPRRKQAAAWTPIESNLADALPLLESRIASITNPARPDKSIVKAVWRAAFEEYTRLIASSASESNTAKMIRDFLYARAPFLPRNRTALLKAWDRKLSRWLTNEGKPGALDDLRKGNGNRVSVPDADVQRLRWSATTKHSGRLDAAWREEYDHLSQSTRALGEKQSRCPRSVVTACNRELLDGLAARRQGKRYLEKLLGTVLRSVENVASMYAWVMDDLTCTIEVFVTNADGTTSLRLIQLIAVMDVRSRKIVGWSASLDEAPSAELVCEAFLDAVRRTGKVPHHLFLENGWVFGRSNNIVGKRNEAGDVVISGLAEYGCEVHHFDPMNPTSKGELEKGFDLLQQRMERHPGYTGRAQRYDAPDQFRHEQIEMRRKVNPRDPKTCRYDFPQGVRALASIVTEYNAAVQHGKLAGLSPDAAFTAFEDRNNPPISVPAKLHWMLAHKYRITVKNSGVKFSHFGNEIRVRGGRVKDYLGRELWAVVDRRDADCVTFMTLDFADVFTEPLRPVVDWDESETNPDSGALRTEFETKAEHRRVIEDQYHGLIDRFGDPREQLLREAQEQSAGARDMRVAAADVPAITAGATGAQQRDTLRKGKKPQRQSPRTTEAARPGYDEAERSIFGTKGKTV